MLPHLKLKAKKLALFSTILCYAVTQAENSPKNLRLKSYRIERRNVEVVYTDSDRVLVQAAIESDDMVIVDGIQQIVLGEIVHLAGF
ncbi:MAG: hypothetical protein HWQ35_12295 [Nostoc sp. NMS1]|uniref:hypothetical protein n=1 Tax=Nostoc sp. NMS1 TaxID=2815388 RepID=UPI0025F3C609|nr:hypothetical protein [Nostoc sp. NMS1]MBN3907307.1 hypothetical protein [Nostoc sp. NMS1]